MSSAPTVVVVHAHPDDEAIFTGLLIRRLADQGGRVVLVTATGGELGEPCTGEDGASLAAVRRRELERACALLGVARLVSLGRRDSGVPGSTDHDHARALVRSHRPALARRVADLAIAEGAAAIVYDDRGGIYGHPDHLTAHAIGAQAARLAGTSGYEVTVDRDQLDGTDHLVTRAAAWLGGTSFGTAFGTRSHEIGLALHGTAPERAAKHAAMAAHSSQISSGELAGVAFDRLYGTEWLTRAHGPAVLDALGRIPPGHLQSHRHLAAGRPGGCATTQPSTDPSTRSASHPLSLPLSHPLSHTSFPPPTRPLGRPHRRFTHVPS